MFFIEALLATSRVEATAQSSDILLIDGQEEALYTNPLDRFLKNNPEVRARVPEFDNPACLMSSNWRGYTATFEITEGELRLNAVSISRGGCETGAEVLEDLFPGKSKVVVEWFNGILVVPKGDLVAYVHLGYGSLYSEYRLFRIESGKVVAEATMDSKRYNAYRERQFRAYKGTGDYKQALAEIMKDGDQDKRRAESFIYNVDTDYITDVMLEF